MKKIILNSVLFAAAFLSMVSCAEWTKQEPVEFKYVTIQEKNPELYAAYLASLREYRNSRHPMMIMKVDNPSTRPSTCAERLDCVPDSADIVVLKNYKQIHEQTLAEAAQIRADKGIKTLAAVSYEDIIADYEAWLEENPEEQDTHEDRVEWVSDHTQAFISIVRKYELDGILAAYAGSNPFPMKSDQKAKYLELQNAFLEPLAVYCEQHPRNIFIFEGTPKYIVDEEYEILDKASCIVIPAYEVTGVPGFSYKVEDNVDAQTPMDKFAVGVSAIDDADELSTAGILSDGSSATVGAAIWVNQSSSKFGKVGVCVDHAQRDYFGIASNYHDTRTAISIMNPSSSK